MCLLNECIHSSNKHFPFVRYCSRSWGYSHEIKKAPALSKLLFSCAHNANMRRHWGHSKEEADQPLCSYGRAILVKEDMQKAS